MTLISDRTRPKTLDDLTVHPKTTELLRNIAQTFAFPHLLFSGPTGSGKKTRILAFLRSLFKADIDRLRSEYRSVDVGPKKSETSESSKKIEVLVTSSQYHIEITPANYGNNDRHVISHFLKEIAASTNVDGIPIKVVVISEAHRLSRLAQQALRRTMEKYARTCRLILVADSLSQIIEPVRSRCFIIRTPRPSSDAVESVVRQAASQIQITLEDSTIAEIALQSKGNMLAALLLLDQLQISPGKPISDLTPDWEVYINKLIGDILKSELSADLMKKIRNHLYDLLKHCIPPTLIFQKLLHGLLSDSDATLMEPVSEAASLYEARMKNGTKEIFHLEAFIAKFIVLYRDYMDGLND